MKLGGKKIEGTKEHVLVLPRDSGDLVFKFVGVVDDKEFDTIFPAPQPPTAFNVKLQQTVRKTDDPNYKAKLNSYYSAHNAWMFLQSIKPSEIEWDTVNLADPTTWSNWEDDLKAAGLTMNERNIIWQTYQRVNMLSDTMLDEARARFLASLAAPPSSPEPSSPSGGSPSTSNGEPANASA